MTRTDTNLAYPALGDPNSVRTPRVVAVAYTNPDADLKTNTVLHDLDVDRAADVDPGLHRSRVRRCDRSRTDRPGRAGGRTLHPGRPRLRGCQVTGSARRGGRRRPPRLAAASGRRPPLLHRVRTAPRRPASWSGCGSTSATPTSCNTASGTRGWRAAATTCYARCRSASPRPPSGPRSRCSSSCDPVADSENADPFGVARLTAGTPRPSPPSAVRARETPAGRRAARVAPRAARPTGRARHPSCARPEPGPSGPCSARDP